MFHKFVLCVSLLTIIWIAAAAIYAAVIFQMDREKYKALGETWFPVWSWGWLVPAALSVVCYVGIFVQALLF